MKPHITCICPTYKRPECLYNAIACFEQQSYENKSLLIIDDAPQHHPCAGDQWRLIPSQVRYPTLPAKFNDLIEIATATDETNIIAIWEDDDIYLPNHLEMIAGGYQEDVALFFRASQVYSTYKMPRGCVRTENASGRFHGAFAYSVDLLQRIGNYTKTSELNFDQVMHQKSSTAADRVVEYTQEKPTYVYRWGNGVYHGSQAGDAGYALLWNALGKREVEFKGNASASFDGETLLIASNLGY